MTVADYTPFVERMIFRYEGDYSWDRNDPGGPTRFGITCYDLAEHRHQHMSSMVAWAPLVRAMSLQEADAIYAQKYATACQFNNLGAGKDCVVFDFGVNSGPSRAIKYAQHVAHVPVDGILGLVTLAAINGMAADTFINQLCNARMDFLRSLSIWRTFGGGWSARVSDVRIWSLGLLEQPGAKKPSFESKSRRIPGAFVKAYGPEELRVLQGTP